MLPQFGKSELSPLKKDKSTQRGKKRKGICLFIKSMSEKKSTLLQHVLEQLMTVQLFSLTDGLLTDT